MLMLSFFYLLFFFVGRTQSLQPKDVRDDDGVAVASREEFVRDLLERQAGLPNTLIVEFEEDYVRLLFLSVVHSTTEKALLL